jgi:hypothetical protein
MSVTDVSLPYRTDWESIDALLDYAKGKGVDRAALEARMGAGESLRETLNAAEQLRLVRRDDAGDIQLTEAGQRIAYAASERERRHELARAVVWYEPYRVPLERALGQGLRVLDGPSVERIWQVDMRLGQPRNRVEEARTFFFRLAGEAGLGTFRRGVRGQPTRLELSPDAGARVEELLDEPVDSAPVEPDASATSPSAISLSPPVATHPGASLSITVDMTDWGLDKIEAFLRLVGMLPGGPSTHRDRA